MTYMPSKEVRALKVRAGTAAEIEDTVAMEELCRFYLNGRLISTGVAEMTDLEYLGAGYVIAEGFAESVKSVKVEGSSVFVESDTLLPECGCGCGSSGSSEHLSIPDKVIKSDLVLSPENVTEAAGAIVSPLWKQTGGVHSAVLFADGKAAAFMTDVGRHNTVDKLIGFAELNGIDRSRCVVACTGRQPYGMVKKCVNAGIPVIISKAASTQSGIELAEKCGVTLIGFARDDRFTIYTHPERITGLKKE